MGKRELTPANEPCRPTRLPLVDLDWTCLVEALVSANRAIAHYDGVLRTIPNPAVLLSPLTANEAVLSSRIEGTQATLQEVLEFESGQVVADTERREDIREILNYRRALHAARESLGVKPLNLGTLLEAHSILLDSVRGHNKARGKFRMDQNWIGVEGTGIGAARYVPPTPFDLQDALTNFENYLHFHERDAVTQMGVIHAQFEILHPFRDGNGRVGRILIPLFLFEKKVINSPMFYLSSYLETHRREYYDRLRAVTVDGDWEGWLLFFLEAVRAQAEANIQKVRSILGLYNSLAKRISPARYSIEILNTLFQSPFFSKRDFLIRSNIPRTTAQRALASLEDSGIIVLPPSGIEQSSPVFCFRELFQIINQSDDFAGISDGKSAD